MSGKWQSLTILTCDRIDVPPAGVPFVCTVLQGYLSGPVAEITEKQPGRHSSIAHPERMSFRSLLIALIDCAGVAWGSSAFIDECYATAGARVEQWTTFFGLWGQFVGWFLDWHQTDKLLFKINDDPQWDQAQRILKHERVLFERETA